MASLVTSEFNGIGSANAQSNVSAVADATISNRNAPVPFGPLKQIDAGVLNIGYAEVGPANGRPVILLHGWPYDIHSFVDVAPLLASAGYRVIVPYLRGYGTTRFLSNDTFRNGQPAAIAVDIITMMDALKIPKATVGGFDWGARTANIMAALWPERCAAMVSVSGYLIGSQAGGKTAIAGRRPSSNGGTNITSPQNEAVKVMTDTDTTSRSSFGSLHRRNGTSTTRRSIAARHRSTIQTTSQSSSTTIGGASGSRPASPYTTDWKTGLPPAPVVGVPTITLEGDANGAPHLDPSAYAKKFTGKYSHRLITGGIGHNFPQEAPQAFAQAIIDVDAH